MMDTETTKQIAQTIASHWQSGQSIDALPIGQRPMSREDGYAAQSHLCDAMASPVVGWKIAATSEAGQKHIGVSGPLAGRIFARTLQQLGEPISLSGNRMRVAEPEMVFTFAENLPPRASAYSLDEVMNAVATLSVAIEVPNARFRDFVNAGEAALIADNACAHQFLPGPTAPEIWRDLNLAQHGVSATVTPAGGGAWTRQGSGAAVLGDPRLALVWIANELRALGVGLRAGEFVTTGTCMVPLEVSPGDQVHVDFGVLGRISANFTD